MRGLWGAAAGHLHSQSFLLSPGRKYDSCQTSKWWACEDQRTCAREKWTPPKKKKIGKTVNLRRHWEGTQWNCRVVSSVRVWVYISLWRGGGREWFYFLPGGAVQTVQRLQQHVVSSAEKWEHTPCWELSRAVLAPPLLGECSWPGESSLF